MGNGFQYHFNLRKFFNFMEIIIEKLAYVAVIKSASTRLTFLNKLIKFFLKKLNFQVA